MRDIVYVDICQILYILGLKSNAFRRCLIYLGGVVIEKRAEKKAWKTEKILS